MSTLFIQCMFCVIGSRAFRFTEGGYFYLNKLFPVGHKHTVYNGLTRVPLFYADYSKNRIAI